MEFPFDLGSKVNRVPKIAYHENSRTESSARE